ncbi:type IX secretion system plug protein [Flavihumibacter profundi]|uniref:type IX secretion system plug protein n=1 Tax=Flavihumibacter profundi TaxID=2716883 RepID=UPI001CC4576B|nr:DUF5103 domain-containing protein [Flavihumibacter profundi]MBZ5856650.1 DUF5103 domain-containing protein [Flavihumibacter profundi]
MVKKFYGILPILLTLLFEVVATGGNAQEPDQVYYSNIQSVKLNILGNQLGYPVIRLNSSDQLELHFDDREGGTKAYSYAWQLCNADWSPANLSPMDYVRGFTQQRIITYRNSSVALTHYTHYMQVLPDRSSAPSRSGNYLLKVFLNGDPNQLAFTRRVLVVEEKAAIAVQVQQPFNNQFFNTHQKIAFTVNTKNLNLANPMQQVTICILQNNRWDNRRVLQRPTFIRQNTLEYNTEDESVFPGGREYRWLDLRSFRLQSDRVDSAQYGNTYTNIFVKPDLDRNGLRFVFYRDANGMYYFETLDGMNPYWQGDYATVNFRFKPPGGIPFTKDLYLFGELTNYGKDAASKMVFNKETKLYETNIWLKQGFYDYGYAIKQGEGDAAYYSLEKTEGNNWETENSYTVLVYYRSLGGRSDELVALSKVNSLTGRPQGPY